MSDLQEAKRTIKYTKDDYINIIKLRGVEIINGISLTQLKNKLLKDIKDAIGEITIDDQQRLFDYKSSLQKDAELSKLKVVELSTKSMRLGGRVSLSKAQLIEEILYLRKIGAKEVNYDENQVAILTSENAIIYGGAGCGKTTTIAGLIQSVENHVIIVYNNTSKHILAQNIKRFGIKFNIFTIYELIKKIKEDTKRIEEIAEEDEELYEIDDVIQDISTHMTFERVIIDEAQDFNDNYSKLIGTIIKHAKSYFIFGDPRQHLFTNASWFNKMKPTHFLNINHRSSPSIVKYLNDFSRKSFGDYHFDMVSSEQESGEIKEISTINTKELASLIKKDDFYPIIYIVCAKSIDHPAIKELCQQIYNISPMQHITIMDNIDNPLKSSTVITTTRKIKGAECDIVFYIDADSPATFKFTALSRAKKSIFYIKNLQYADEFSQLLPVFTRAIERSSLRGVPYEKIPIIKKGKTLSIKSGNNLSHEKILISVDIETYFENIIEICAVVYDMATSKIVEYFKILPNGINEFSSDYTGQFVLGTRSESTGLHCKNLGKISADQARIVDEFKKFASKYEGAIFLQYAGSDDLKLGITNSIDVYSIFKSWLDINGITRVNELSLEHMVKNIYGFYMPFMPHRAMEDAVFTLLCYLSIM